MPRLMCAPETAQEALEAVHYLHLAAQLLMERPARELTDDVDEAAALGALSMLLALGYVSAPTPDPSPNGREGIVGPGSLDASGQDSLTPDPSPAGRGEVANPGGLVGWITRFM